MKTPPATPSSTAAAELLPCPFCGEVPKCGVETVWDWVQQHHDAVKCRTEKCCLYNRWFDLPEWNRRAAPARQPETMERVLRAARECAHTLRILAYHDDVQPGLRERCRATAEEMKFALRDSPLAQPPM